MARKKRRKTLKPPEDMQEMMESLESLVGLLAQGSAYHCDCMRVLKTNTQLASLARESDAIETAAVFAGLTTCPELQSNLYRLEGLVHAFTAMSTGANKPTANVIRDAFSCLGQTPVGRGEDPAESVFVSCVSNDQGSFRTFEGLWESNAFFLQRFLDVVDGMPSGQWFSRLREQVLALLRLSDALAAKCALQKYTVGSEDPLESIPGDLLGDIPSLSGRISFTGEDLKRLQISPRDLAPFICDLSKRACLVGDALSVTLLERHPIVNSAGRWYLMLPSAIGAAIRILVIEEVSKANMLPQLEAQLAISYAKHFRSIELLGDMGHRLTPFARNERVHAFTSDSVVRIDEGRFVHLLFFVDNFTGAEEGWLLGRNANVMELAEEISKSIESARSFAAQSNGFKEGITLITYCGWGRSSSFAVPNEERENWRIETISAPDLTTLSLSPGFGAFSLWRLLYAKDKLTKAGGILHNINGLLNLYAWSRELKHHLVPHEQVPADSHFKSFLIYVDQNCLLKARREAYQAWDLHVRLSPEGKPVKVCKFFQSSYFEEDARNPLYGSKDDIAQGRLRAVYLGSERDWWCDIAAPDKSDREVVYHLFEAIVGWMRRLVPALEAVLTELPRRAIAWHFVFASVELPEHPPEIPCYEELKSLIDVSHDDHHRINLTISTGFMKGFACEKNVAERCMVWAMVKGAVLTCKQVMTEDQIEQIVGSIIPDEDARSFHVLRATTFLDYVAEFLPEIITIDESDDASLRIGLGWLGRSRDAGPRITGIDECTNYIAGLLDHVWADIRNVLSGLDRERLVERLLLNLEAARVEQSRWNRTIRACLAQHADKNDVLKAATVKTYSLNAAMLGSRISLEMALCECPLSGGAVPGEIEIAKLLAYGSLVHHLGGYSDAIRYGAMPAEIIISHFGDVMMDHSFSDTVLYRFGNEMHKRKFHSEAERYGELFQEAKGSGCVEHLFKAEFNDAWLDEFGFTIDQCRAYIDHLEELAIERHTAVMRLHKRELMDWEDDFTGISRGTVRAIVNTLRLWRRPSWPSAPEGFLDRDWQPWRFRRRLSVVERPLIQLDNTDDPVFLVAPDLIREGFIYVCRCSYEAAYEEKRFKSRKMRRWIGTRRNGAGHDFNKKVAQRLTELGWTARSSVKLTEVLNSKLDRDYGDIDVLGWNQDANRVLVIECKDLGFVKTHGEVAAQLQEFRGRNNEKGKPDKLKRHLNRLDVLRSRQDAVAKYIGARQVPKIEGHLVFENLAPVAFSLDDALTKVTITEYRSLDSI